MLSARRRLPNTQTASPAPYRRPPAPPRKDAGRPRPGAAARRRWRAQPPCPAPQAAVEKQSFATPVIHNNFPLFLFSVPSVSSVVNLLPPCSASSRRKTVIRYTRTVGWGEERTPTIGTRGCWGSFLTPTYRAALRLPTLRRCTIEVARMMIEAGTKAHGMFGAKFTQVIPHRLFLITQ